MKDHKLSEVKANCKKMYYADKPNEMPYLHCEICEHRRIKEFGKLWCEYIEEPINWQIDEDETKEQLEKENRELKLKLEGQDDNNNQ